MGMLTQVPVSQNPSQFLISSLPRGTACLQEDSSENGTCPYSPWMSPTAHHRPLQLYHLQYIPSSPQYHGLFVTIRASFLTIDAPVQLGTKPSRQDFLLIFTNIPFTQLYYIYDATVVACSIK